jgi:hypothetical protein
VTEILAAIDAKHFYAGIVLQDDRVVEAAPIVKYMKNWSRDRVRDYCKDKGWNVTVIWQMQRYQHKGV